MSIEISGKNFDSDNLCKFDGAEVSPLSVSSGKLTCNVPTASSDTELISDIRIVSHGVSSKQTFSFSYDSTPVVFEMSHGFVAVGWKGWIRLSGSSMQVGLNFLLRSGYVIS